MERRQIDFAWTLVDWRTFDPGGAVREDALPVLRECCTTPGREAFITCVLVSREPAQGVSRRGHHQSAVGA